MLASFWATPRSDEKADLGSGLRTPLSKTTALYLTPSQTPRQGIASRIAKPFEVDDLNYESAARARLWLVGEQARIEDVRTQVTACQCFSSAEPQSLGDGRQCL
jgi:hypothetical protein